LEIDMARKDETAYTHRQMRTKATGIKGVMRSAAFVRGFTEARVGIKMDYEAFHNDTNQRWAYERGRQFGCIFDGPLKYGQSINMGAALQFSLALGRKEIF
jgi:hypothetical protein